MARPVTAGLASVLAGSRLLPVLTVPSVASAGPLADALAAGGVRCAEVTFRTPDAERVVKGTSPACSPASCARPPPTW
ncbi:hypothetical protein [Streptomyces sp. NPDC056683]|uniref:hypothetical protein n=1 Tax=Streptomyces sp. NPDC056683 TaxID=3345910 RepID=UPI0036BD4FAD